MKAEFEKIIYERTGRLGNVAVCARVWREAPARLEWAYGANEADALRNLEAAPVVIELNALELEVCGE